MMLALLCAVFVLPGESIQQAPEGTKRPIFERLGMVRTGKNGYEEYVLAIDRLNSLPQDALQEYREAKVGTHLSRSRNMSSAYASVITLVKEGNKKPAFDPKDVLSIETPYPETMGFGRVALVFCGDVYAKLADGRSSASTDSLLAVLEFSDRIGRGLPLSCLVAYANRSLVLGAIDGSTLQFAQPDALRIEKYLDQALRRRLLAGDAILLDAKVIASSLRHYARTGSTSEELSIIRALMGPVDDSESTEFDKELDQMSQAQLRAVYRDAAAELDQHTKRLEVAFAQPEEKWTPEMTALDIHDISSYVAAMLITTSGALVESEQRSRAQLRLLRLHMLICAFRWEHRRLPETLAQLQAPEAVKDPLGGEFQYDIRAESSYRLYSKGTKSTGEIDMRYRRQTEPPTGPIDPD